MSKLWVKFEDYEVTQVSTQGCFILYEFIKAVKKTLPRKLGDYDLDQISFSLTKGGPPLNPNIPLPASNTASEPLYIKVIESSLERDIYNEEHHNHYDQLGKVLASDPIISQIVDTLSNIFSLESYNPKPFILIQDSTGSGKTQCAFALKYAIEQYPQFKFFYLRCSSDCDTLSQVFQECVQMDMQMNWNCRLSCLALARASLYVYGFFFQLLTNSGPTMVLQRKTVHDIWNVLNGIQVVVVLDDFFSSGKICKLLCNSIRSLEFGLVAMGTHFSTATFSEKLQQSRGCLAFDWCFLFPRVPRMRIENGLENGRNKWVRLLLESSRPLFSVIAIEKTEMTRQPVITLEDMDKWLTKIAIEMNDAKSIFESSYGLVGQVCLFMNMFYSKLDPQGTDFTLLIDQHYARLSDSLMVCLDSNMDKDLVPWKVVSSFPSPSEDLLLLLCLMGTKEFFPFRKSDKVTRISFRKAAEKVQACKRDNQLALAYENQSQILSDEMFLEALFVSSLCVASRSSGLAGQSLGSFIGGVWSHVRASDEFQSFSLELPKSKALTEFLNCFWIPILAPPNQKWPDWVHQIPGSKFGWLERTRNQDMLVVNTDFKVTGESMYYEPKVSRQSMKAILARVPKASKVHIIFVRKLSRTFAKNHLGFMNLCCCAVQEMNGVLRLSDIKGLPGMNSFKQKGSKLVLFFIIE